MLVVVAHDCEALGLNESLASRLNAKSNDVSGWSAGDHPRRLSVGEQVTSTDPAGNSHCDVTRERILDI